MRFITCKHVLRAATNYKVSLPCIKNVMSFLLFVLFWAIAMSQSARDNFDSIVKYSLDRLEKNRLSAKRCERNNGVPFKPYLESRMTF